MSGWNGDRRLETKQDAANLLLDMIRPLKTHYSAGHSWLKIGNTGVHYGEKAAEMEGFARILWGLGPLWAGEEELDHASRMEAESWRVWYLEGIVHGTDPENEEYWGTVTDYDQKMVEMAALVTAVSLCPQKLWEPLTEEQRRNLYQWLNQINQREVHANNWRYFRILVNMMFRLLDLPWSEEMMEKDWEVIEHCYMDKGWYYDGNPGQIDYYIPFAMHFYGMIYARMMEQKEPERCRILKERAALFAEDFIYWFAGDGNEIPFGRSLTYRFAHSAFFSAFGFAGISSQGEQQCTQGAARHLVLKNLENWMKRPIFDNAGIMTIGYGYPNLFMSERYNGAGSPYWALKVFLMLAVPGTDEFWTDADAMIEYKRQKRLDFPHMLITHDKNHHVMAFTAGQHCLKNHGHCTEKYEKFVYSNQFGFSVSREAGLQEGAFDNALAVSLKGDNCYRMRCKAENYQVTDQAVKMRYQIMPGVSVETIVIPCAPWHVRIHRIQTEMEIDAADGGFAIAAEPGFHVVQGEASGKITPEQICFSESGVFAVLPWGVSGAVDLLGGECRIVDAFPNTNLLYHLTVIPTVTRSLKPGVHLMASAFLGDTSAQAEEWISKRPEICIKETVKVKYGDEEIIETL